MQINANYSVNGVPYDNKRKQNNIPQFSTECAVQENENINPYMAEADFDEKAFDMIGPNAPQDVKDAWMEAAKDINANGMGIKKNGVLLKVSSALFFFSIAFLFQKPFQPLLSSLEEACYLPPAAYAASRILLPQISFRRTSAACKRLLPCPRRHRPPASLLPCVSEFYGCASKCTCRTCVCICPAPNHHSRHIQSKKAINM